MSEKKRFDKNCAHNEGFITRDDPRPPTTAKTLTAETRGDSPATRDRGVEFQAPEPDRPRFGPRFGSLFGPSASPRRTRGWGVSPTASPEWSRFSSYLGSRPGKRSDLTLYFLIVPLWSVRPTDWPPNSGSVGPPPTVGALSLGPLLGARGPTAPSACLGGLRHSRHAGSRPHGRPSARRGWARAGKARRVRPAVSPSAWPRGLCCRSACFPLRFQSPPCPRCNDKSFFFTLDRNCTKFWKPTNEMRSKN